MVTATYFPAAVTYHCKLFVSHARGDNVLKLFLPFSPYWCQWKDFEPLLLGLCVECSTTVLTPLANLFHLMFTIFYQVECELFCIENDAEIFPAHYTWKVADKGFKMAFMMNKLAIINSCEIILEK